MKDKKIDIWAMDEVHFQQYGSCCRMWVPPEVSNPILLHQPTRKSAGYFGAVRLRDGKFVYRRERECFNAENFFEFLKQIRRNAVKNGRCAVIIIDNAKFHHAKLHKKWRNKHADQFKLEFLPPYSPDLNPCERVWKLTRRLCIHNIYFPQMDMVINSVEKQFSAWGRGNETIRKLCAIN